MKRDLERGNEVAHCKSKNAFRCIWSEEEDSKLFEMANKYKGGYWNNVAKAVGGCASAGCKKKTAKQCRERWHNQVNPKISDASFSESEEKKIFTLHQKYGNKWSKISCKLTGRTDNDVKNYFLCKLRKMVRCLKKDRKEDELTSTEVDIEKIIYLLDYLYKFYISPERTENIRKSLNTQIKKRKNKGDKYVNKIIGEEDISFYSISSYLKRLLPTPPSSLKQQLLQKYEYLTHPATDTIDSNKDQARVPQEVVQHTPESLEGTLERKCHIL